MIWNTSAGIAGSQRHVTHHVAARRILSPHSCSSVYRSRIAFIRSDCRSSTSAAAVSAASLAADTSASSLCSPRYSSVLQHAASQTDRQVESDMFVRQAGQTWLHKVWGAEFCPVWVRWGHCSWPQSCFGHRMAAQHAGACLQSRRSPINRASHSVKHVDCLHATGCSCAAPVRQQQTSALRVLLCLLQR